MKFKEFSNWCNKRVHDGCWGCIEAITCCKIVENIYSKPFWKREKIWHEVYENTIVNEIVSPINKKIKELEWNE